jgi:uncharacterized protein YdaU (DUF1376 family)
MRFWVRRWLDDQRIRGKGDDGQRVGGLTLAQEAVYLRLCLAQFVQQDGYLPNRKAFLCDAVGCPSGSPDGASPSTFEDLILPVISRFFNKTKDGSRLYNLRVRAEWEYANEKTVKALHANKVRWEREKKRLSSSNADGDPDGDPVGDPDGASKRERERDVTDNTPISPLSADGAPPNGDPPDPPADAEGQQVGSKKVVERIARLIRVRWGNGEPIPRDNLRRIRAALVSMTEAEITADVMGDQFPEYLQVVDKTRI